MFGQVPDIEHVSAEEALALVAGESILVDVREPWEWDLGHAPQAINLPMSQLEQRHEELPQDATLLIVCHSGQRSLGVTDALARAGYSAVNVDGGMIAWQLAGGEIVSDGSQPPRV